MELSKYNNLFLDNNYAAYLCDDITDDSTGGSLEKLSAQTMRNTLAVSESLWNTLRSPGIVPVSPKWNAGVQGRRLSRIFNTVGSKQQH